MLIERDGSDTPPSRFSYSVGDRAQLSHFDKSQATKTAAALSGGMDLCFRSFPPSGAAAFTASPKFRKEGHDMRPLIVMNGENIDWFHTVIRMLMYLAGVAILALGMSIQTASGLGVAALTCFATTLSMLTGKTLGFWITATYVAYIAAQAVILRREFQLRILLEIFFSTLIGGFTDFFMAVNPLHPTALPAQVATMLLSLAVTAFGVSLVVNMGVVPNAPDGLVQVIAEKLKRRFGDVKVVFDCSHVAVSLILSLALMHNLGGFGVTTAISALFLGHVINVANKLFAQHFIRATFG